MQDEGRSSSYEGIFGSNRKEEAGDTESRVEEERKEEVVGRKTEAVGDREEVEGRT